MNQVGHDWRCPECGFYRDTPNHELGCPAGRAEGRRQPGAEDGDRPVSMPSMIDEGAH